MQAKIKYILHVLLVVFGEESVLEEDEVVLDHDLSAEDHGQELVVRDVLVQCRHHMFGFLKLNKFYNTAIWKTHS